MFYKNADGYLVGFDLTSLRSFDTIKYFIESIEENRNEDFPLNLVIFGNKCDKLQDIKVKDEDIEQIIKICNVPFFKTSSKDGTNVTNLFEYIFKIALINNKKLMNEIGLSEDTPFESIKLIEKEIQKILVKNSSRKRKRK